MATVAAGRGSGAEFAGRQATTSAGIGPNAIIQFGVAIDHHHGEACKRAIFEAAGLGHYLVAPPATLVDENEVLRLHANARKQLRDSAYRRCAGLAGSLTGAYLVAHRIPRPVRILLRLLPQALACRILTRAIERNAWTFVGSGRFHSSRQYGQIELIIENSPLARGLASPKNECVYYASTFERLYRELVDRSIEIRECRCLASGAQDCRFEIATRRGKRQTRTPGPGKS